MLFGRGVVRVPIVGRVRVEGKIKEMYGRKEDGVWGKVKGGDERSIHEGREERE